MSSRADYTSAEWTELLLAPIQAGIAVMLAEKSGLYGTAQEAFALYKSTNENVAKQYPNNELIQNLLTGENKEEEKQVFQKIGTYIKDASARQQARPEAIHTCNDISRFLNQKASPSEAQEYKQWLMDVCTGVASAAKEEGKPISPAESAAMKEIERALTSAP